MALSLVTHQIAIQLRWSENKQSLTPQSQSCCQSKNCYALGLLNVFRSFWKLLNQEHQSLKTAHQLLQKKYKELKRENQLLQKKHEELQRENQRLIYEVNHDALTGLYNRRYLKTYIEKACTTASSLGHELSLLVIDIDHFKQYNDTYGHLAGDQLLQKIGEYLFSVVQTSDNCIARCGGEEFVAVLPNHNPIAAVAIAKTVQSVFGTLGITVSIGIASYGKDGKTWPELLACADRRLYSAKQDGRNRIAM